MSQALVSQNRNTPTLDEAENEVHPSLVLAELSRILASRHFQTSPRGKEFLQYVVNQKICGNADQLKERVIGVQIFGRKPDYATGEDPVVRVKAGDVRRRLELYYADTAVASGILIQIPLGSYAPIFRLTGDSDAIKGSGREGTWLAHPGTGASGEIDENFHEPSTEGAGLGHGTPESARAEFSADTPIAVDGFEQTFHETAVRTEAAVDIKRDSRRRRRAAPWVAMVFAFALLALLVSLVVTQVRKAPGLPQKDFWLPASLSSKPVLLWLPKPMVYRPSPTLFDRYGKTHPNTFVTREERSDRILALAPTDTIQWSDMMPDYNSGPGIGGVIAGMNINKLLTQRGIRFELRFGEEASYAEMRSSPVVIIGAINADWATELTSELPFVFDETPGAASIREVGGAKRVWKTETGGSNGRIIRDYGLITRQLSGKTGQFLVQVAGISHFGTEAASEMLVQEPELARALRSESIGLQNKNLQIVVSTDLTDRRTGPPHIVAISSW